MKDNITRLAKGNFRYMAPQVEIEATQLNQEIVCGEILDGTVTIHSDGDLKGVAYSNDARVTIEDSFFAGKCSKIEFHVTAKMMQEEGNIQGIFYFVTNAGEYELPYSFHVVKPQYKTSIGNIHNLLQFANLVQMEPKEAEKIFMSEQFVSVFLENNVYLENMYHLLKQKTDVEIAMEEFLIVAKKKSPVQFSLLETHRTFGLLTENLREEILIEKSYWGHFSLHITADAPFVKIMKTRLTELDFTGNKCILNYVIDKEKLHAGINTAAVCIQTPSQTLRYEIQVDNTQQKQEEGRIHKEERNAYYELTKGYLDYRMLKKPAQEWLEASNHILERVRGIAPENKNFQLMQAQLYIMQNRPDEAKWLLDTVKEQISQQDVLLYCYWLYIDSLYQKDRNVTKQAYQKVLYFYENGNDNWELLWMLFYLDGQHDKNQSLRLARIKDMYHNGYRSPVMYYEALCILNEQPVLLRVFNAFELEVLYFGCKYGVIEKNLAEYICARMELEKVIPYRELQLLEKINDLYSDDTMLNVLVTHMVRNELIGNQYFSIYEKGVLRKLRITRLYEYYIASMDKSKMPRLPQIVLMYFAYETNLDYENKAYLYANILTNESNDIDVMKAYNVQIETFAREQMQLRHIDANLILIYQYYSRRLTLSEENREFFSRLAFAYKITCFDERMKRVIVQHKEFDIEMVYPIVHSVAYIQMYTSECAIAFEEENGTRHGGDIRYEQERVLQEDKLRKDICAANMENINIQIYAQEVIKEQTYIGEEAITNCQNILSNDNLSRRYRRQLTGWLVNYFYENREARFMDIAADIRMEDCNQSIAMQMAELFVQNYRYDAALFYISQYGYRNISSIVLFRLVHHFAQLYNEQMKEDSLLLELCVYLLKIRKYDKEILQYLSSYYNADNTQMFTLWLACESFDVERRELEERLVSQLLFTRECSQRLAQVFAGYRMHGVQQEVQKAYINYRCYQAFVHELEEDTQVYPLIERMTLDGEQVLEVCQLSLIRHYAQVVNQKNTEHSNRKDVLDVQQRQIAQKYIQMLCEQEHLFSFFLDLREIVKLPYNLLDKTIIEYRTYPNVRVEIHYARENTEIFETEVMKSTIEGVFTQVITLFYGDSIRFYFTEDGNTVQQAEIHNLTCDNCAAVSVDNRYDYMNEMFASKDLHDMVSLKRMMEKYCIQDYVVRELFRPL